jgi:hypothetical protein
MIRDPMPVAVRAPLSFAGEGGALVKLARLQAEFSPVLGVRSVFVRHQGSEHFISGRPGDTLSLHSQEACSGEPRYDWKDRGDGVLYGFARRPRTAAGTPPP